ncbi:unnamed protein product, partial [Choristocarpus tenellus]
MAHKVQLALYDLSRGLAKSMSMAILGKQIDGIWHTGVIVYGKEYFFGGGLQSMPHDVFVASHGGVGPNEYIDMGATDLPQDVFEDFNREISSRYTAQTYDLLKHNCNNYSDEVTTFLLGKGIPEYIINLPNEVLNSPMGGMLRPMLEQMTMQMNGADPFAASHQQPNGVGGGVGDNGVGPPVPLAPAPSPNHNTAPNSMRAVVTGSSGQEFPVLDKHTKPLVGSDTGGAAATVAARLKAIGAGVEGLLSKEESALLDALPASLLSSKGTPVCPGSYALLLKILKKPSKWSEKAEFLALLILSLVVLHALEGQEHMATISEVLRRVQIEGDFSDK